MERQMIYPLIALRGITVFPGIVIHFDLNRKKISECLIKNGDYSKNSEIAYVKRMVKNENN